MQSFVVMKSFPQLGHISSGTRRREIKDLERGGHATKAANELLERMLVRTDAMCVDRDRQRQEQKAKYRGTDKIIKGPIER